MQPQQSIGCNPQMFGSHSPVEFKKALETFVEGIKRVYEDYMIEMLYQNNDPWEVQWLQKRIRIKHGGSAHSFIDMATGDVFKPASWAAPAKHARGNIYDEHNGLKSMGPYGPAYLR